MVLSCFIIKQLTEDLKNLFLHKAKSNLVYKILYNSNCLKEAL